MKKIIIALVSLVAISAFAKVKPNTDDQKEIETISASKPCLVRVDTVKSRTFVNANLVKFFGIDYSEDKKSPVILSFFLLGYYNSKINIAYPNEELAISALNQFARDSYKCNPFNQK